MLKEQKPESKGTTHAEYLLIINARKIQKRSMPPSQETRGMGDDVAPLFVIINIV